MEGAPESIISRCTSILCNDDGSTVPLTENIRAELESRFHRLCLLSRIHTKENVTPFSVTHTDISTMHYSLYLHFLNDLVSELLFPFSLSHCWLMHPPHAFRASKSQVDCGSLTFLFPLLSTRSISNFLKVNLSFCI